MTDTCEHNPNVICARCYLLLILTDPHPEFLEEWVAILDSYANAQLTEALRVMKPTDVHEYTLVGIERLYHYTSARVRKQQAELGLTRH